MTQTRPYTDDEIDAMEAGRDLDATIAIHLFGWKWMLRKGENDTALRFLAPPNYKERDSDLPSNGNEPCWSDWDSMGLPHYSAILSSAWLVIEKMDEDGFWCQMRTPFGKGSNNDGYWAGFTPHLTTGWNGRPDHQTSAESMPLSICRASLKCAMEEKEEGVTA